MVGGIALNSLWLRGNALRVLANGTMDGVERVHVLFMTKVQQFEQHSINGKHLRFVSVSQSNLTCDQLRMRIPQFQGECYDGSETCNVGKRNDMVIYGDGVCAGGPFGTSGVGGKTEACGWQGGDCA